LLHGGSLEETSNLIVGSAGLRCRWLRHIAEKHGSSNNVLAASVHEHLGEARIGDDGIDDERVDPRIRDIVRMVITIERDGGPRPVEEEGGCKLYGEDLSTLALSLARGKACRGLP
jgi:hypothetical protein